MQDVNTITHDLELEDGIAERTVMPKGPNGGTARVDLDARDCSPSDVAAKSTAKTQAGLPDRVATLLSSKAAWFVTRKQTSTAPSTVEVTVVTVAEDVGNTAPEAPQKAKRATGRLLLGVSFLLLGVLALSLGLGLGLSLKGGEPSNAIVGGSTPPAAPSPSAPAPMTSSTPSAPSPLDDERDQATPPFDDEPNVPEDPAFTEPQAPTSAAVLPEDAPVAPVMTPIATLPATESTPVPYTKEIVLHLHEPGFAPSGGRRLQKIDTLRRRRLDTMKLVTMVRNAVARDLGFAGLTFSTSGEPGHTTGVVAVTAVDGDTVNTKDVKIELRSLSSSLLDDARTELTTGSQKTFAGTASVQTWLKNEVQDEEWIIRDDHQVTDAFSIANQAACGLQLTLPIPVSDGDTGEADTYTICTGRPDKFSKEVVKNYVEIIGWEFQRRSPACAPEDTGCDTSATIAQGQVKLTMPALASSDGTTMNVKGYVGAPAGFATGPPTAADGTEWTLLLDSAGSWDFGSGFKVPALDGIVRRLADGRMESQLWSKAPIGEQELGVASGSPLYKLFRIRGWSMRSTLLWSGTTDYSLEGRGIANSALCVDGSATMQDIEFSVSYAAAALTLSASCPLGATFATAGEVPGIQSIELSQLGLQVSALAEKVAQVTLESNIKIATSATTSTGNKVGSDCKDESEALCLVASASAAFTTQSPVGTYSGQFGLSVTGVWLHPLSMRNFALVGPKMQLEVISRGASKGFASAGWTDASIFYKKTAAEWPSGLYTKDTALDALQAEPASKMLQATSSLLYAPFPHGDSSVPSAYPVFGIKLSLSKLSVGTILLMTYDAAYSVFSLLSGVSAPHSPDKVLADVLYGANTWLDAVEFDGDMHLSYVTRGAAEQPDWSRGLDVTATAAAPTSYLGLSLTLSMKLTYVPADEHLKSFCLSPVSEALHKGKLQFSAAAATLPFGMGSAAVTITVTPDAVGFMGSGELQIGGFTPAFILSKTTEGVLYIKVDGALGPFGNVKFEGSVDASQPISWSSPYSFTLLGLAISGKVGLSANVGAASLSATLTADSSLGFFGEIGFTGSIASSGEYTMTGTVSTDVKGLVAHLGSSLAEAILGTASNVVTNKLTQFISALPFNIVGATATYGGVTPLSPTAAVTPATMEASLDVQVNDHSKTLKMALCAAIGTATQVAACLAQNVGSDAVFSLLKVAVGDAVSVSFSLSAGSFFLDISPPGGLAATRLTTPTFSTSATVKLKLTDSKVRLEGSITMASDSCCSKTFDWSPSTSLTVGVPALSKSLEGSLELEKSQLTSGFEIELCKVIPQIETAELCFGGGYHNMPDKFTWFPETPFASAQSFDLPSTCVKLKDIVPCSSMKISA